MALVFAGGARVLNAKKFFKRQGASREVRSLFKRALGRYAFFAFSSGWSHKQRFVPFTVGANASLSKALGRESALLFSYAAFELDAHVRLLDGPFKSSPAFGDKAIQIRNSGSRI